MGGLEDQTRTTHVEEVPLLHHQTTDQHSYRLTILPAVFPEPESVTPVYVLNFKGDLLQFEVEASHD